MRRFDRTLRSVMVTATLLAVAATLLAQERPTRATGKPMSVHNRLLLNRHVVTGYQTVEVLLLFNVEQLDLGLQQLAHVGGQTRRVERSIGYARAIVPTEKVVELVQSPTIDAYQIASLSKGAWYRDGRPQENAELLRGQEVSPLIPADSRPMPDRPLLTVDAAHQINRAADREVGIHEWLAAHPTYDGRGVTIALLESAQPEFEHPAFHSAKTLDGADVPKFAGIINALDVNEPDETRVELGATIEASTSWHRVGARTFILPGQGRYRLGAFKIPAGGTLFHEFGVLRSDATGEIRVDTDGDADFREEPPIVPSETDVHVRHLHLTFPRKVDVAFAVTEGRSSQHLHVYIARQGHQAMTASVAAGNRNDDSLAYGVAPGARVLLVRMMALGSGLQGIEAYIDVMQRPDVDVVSDSVGFIMLPDTSADFMGLFVSRLIDAYGKPIVHGAGNAGGRLNSVSPLGGAFSVGGISEPDSYAALYGRGTLANTIVDPRSAFGPALDGALKPDFLAPVNRIAAGLYTDRSLALPTNAPTANAPVGYEISCCTSATSPYAAGVIALLLSGAKQAGVPYSVESLGRALRVSAQFLPGFSSYEQGSGLLHVSAAWTELQRAIQPPRITVSGPNAHVLTPYAAAGSRGPGLFEREGWRAGVQGERALTFTRMSGTAQAETYRLTWTGNDGTFETATSITLPFQRTTPLSVRIHPRTPGAHGAILNLHDPITEAIVLRAHVTVVATEQFNASSQTIQASGKLQSLRSATHYVAVPPDATTIRLLLNVTRGAPKISLLRGDGQARNYYFHLHPGYSRAFPPGEYSLVLPEPSAGTWGVMLSNTSSVHQGDSAFASDADTVYALSVQLMKAVVEAHRTSEGLVAANITNVGATLRRPVIDVSTGTFRTHRGTLPATGMPSQIAIDVPNDASTLMLRARGADTNTLDMFLYDCTSGECFNYDFTLPSGPAHTFVVRKPKAGRWVAAFNSAPQPTRPGGFVLEEIITSNVQRHEPAHTVVRPHGAKWRELIAMPSVGVAPSGATPIVLVEVVDAAAEHHALANPWENRPELPNLAERSVAIGSAILRVP